jgi:hypothetical protein
MTTWTVTIEEADDGSEDLVLPLPQNLLDQVGWREGDVLEWSNNEDGTYYIQKVKDEKDLL